MGRTYDFVIDALASLTAVPFAQIATPATMAVAVLRIEIGQEASETSEQLCITVTRRSTASTLPTATTLRATNEAGPASLLTATTTTNAQGIASVTGTLTHLQKRFCFNALNGLLWVATPAEIITVKPSGFLTLQFATAPAAGTWSGQITLEELI